MLFTIGEIAEKLQIPASTLRYYEKEGLLANVPRSDGGVRLFSEAEIDTLKMIECLKTTGMQIKDIKVFLDWCAEGESTLKKRRDMFYERKAAVERQIEELQKTLDIIRFKCWYYETACRAGSEEVPRNTPLEEMPEDARRGKLLLEASLTDE